MQDKDLKFYKIVGQLLREERLKQNKKFTIFCYENEIPTSTLNTIEKGSSQAYFLNVAKVIKALGLTFEEFGKLLDKELPENLFKNLE